jgi:hypothetical protein
VADAVDRAHAYNRAVGHARCFSIGALVAFASGCGARTALPTPDPQADTATALDAGARPDAFMPPDAFVLPDAHAAPDASSRDAGPSCGAVAMLPARLFTPTTTRTTTQRPDLHIDTTMWEQTPTIIEDTSVWLVRPSAATHLVVAGDGAATARWYVDNFVLFEVLDCAGSRIAVAFAGYVNGPLTQDGTPVPQLGSNAFDFGPTDISLDELVPIGAPVRVLATALDNGGWVSISDVFVVSR